jgi:uncharacterized protein
LIIDVNTYIGHWAFRQIPQNTAEALVRRMDAHGIDRAVVASTHGILYKNVHPANEELSAQTAPFRDRLISFATLNPTFPGWREDLRRCVQDLDLRGIRLYPQYHGYHLADDAARALIDAATELAWAVQVPMRVVDRRQRHAWDLAQDIRPDEFEKAFALHPQTRWMVLNGLGFDGARLAADAQVLIEISRMTSVLQRNIPALIETAGAGHLAFGTGMPFKVPDPALLKLDVLDAPRDTVEKIAWRNAAQMLNLSS